MNQPHLFWNVECRKFCCGTSFIYSVYTPFKYRYLSIWYIISFLCRWFPLHKSSVPSDFPDLACCLKDCIEDVAEWMADSKLKMNDNKTELFGIGTRSKLSQVIPNLAPMSISGCDIQFSQSVRNLAFYLDEMLSIDAHIKYLCRILFRNLRRIGKKSAPSFQLMLPTNLLFLSFSLG